MGALDDGSAVDLRIGQLEKKVSILDENIDMVKRNDIEMKSEIKAINKSINLLMTKYDTFNSVPYEIKSINEKIDTVLDGLRDQRKFSDGIMSSTQSEFNDVDKRLVKLENKEAQAALEDKKMLRNTAINKIFNVTSTLVTLGLLAYLTTRIGG